MGFDNIANDFKNIRSHAYRKIWEPFMKKYQCDYVCELGVCRGENFMNMIAHGPKVAVAVDIWLDDGVPEHNDGRYSQEVLNEQYNNFRNQVKDIPGVQIIRDYTVNAAKLFPNEFFDFVYIDADHRAESCYLDIINWYPKVKSGKFLVGHDYRRRFGVVDAVNKFIKEQSLELIFLPPSTWAVIKK
jgi:hypothetical protein